MKDVSFTLCGREVLGIAGLVGSGRTELLRAVFGADRAPRGWLRLVGGTERGLFRTPNEAVRAGVVMISEDRKADGLLLTESIASNIQLPMLDLHLSESRVCIGRARLERWPSIIGRNWRFAASQPTNRLERSVVAISRRWY